MKTLFLFLLILAGQTTDSFSQSLDSVPLGCVTYIQKTDAPGDQSKNGICTLLFNSSCSVYIHNQAPRRDSSFASPEYISANVPGDEEGFPIYKMHLQRKILLKVSCRRIFHDNCILTDTFGTIQWTLHPEEHRRFGQYDCRKASGNFRGRSYEAWYAPDIPVPSGPFKLGGLPGLILEARSTDGKVQFLFSRLQMAGQLEGVIRPPHGLETHQRFADFIAEDDKFSEQVIKNFKAQYGRELTITRQETIELNANDR